MKIQLILTIDGFKAPEGTTDEAIAEDVCSTILDGYGFPPGLTAEARLIGKFWDEVKS